MSCNCAPIVLFVYNRPWHTLKTLESLYENELANCSTLYVFADGPKDKSSSQQIKDIEKTRSVVKQKQWCKDVVIVERNENIGLSNSVINGVSEIVNKHGKIIVLEDDLVLSRNFLKYMNEALNLYLNHNNIYSINAYMFPINFDNNCTFLLPYISSWGWATWKNKWDYFDQNISTEDINAINNNQVLKRRFNLENYDYAHMLKYSTNSWAIKWYYSVFIKHGLNVFPTMTMVKNIGFDGSGTNCPIDEQTNKNFSFNNYVNIEADVKLNLNNYNLYLSYFVKPKKSLAKKITSRLKKCLKRLSTLLLVK